MSGYGKHFPPHSPLWTSAPSPPPVPDPRDAVIAQLVDALYAIEMWDAARGYPIPYRHRDPMRAAIAAAKAVMPWQHPPASAR